MNHKPLYYRLQAQIRAELPQYLDGWTSSYGDCIPLFIRELENISVESLQEQVLDFVSFIYKSRPLFKIFEQPIVLQQCVALEVILSILAEKPELLQKFLIKLRPILIGTIHSIYNFLQQSSNNLEPVPFLASEHDKLLLIVHTIDKYQRYKYTWQCLKVRHSEQDSAYLELCVSDFVALKRKNTQLYIIELDWDDFLERSRGFIGFLEYFNRNGQVYDICPHTDFWDAETPASEFIVRILYASSLDIDFVEACFRIPHRQIHLVNQDKLRQNLPAWGLVKPESEVFCLLPEPTKSVEDLISEYNTAFTQMVAESQEEQRQVWAKS